jgi:hypothetical protein
MWLKLRTLQKLWNSINFNKKGLTMKTAILAASLVTSFALIPMHAAHAEADGKFSLETGMDYNTGKYGGSQSTDIFYVPFTGKYQGKEWTLKVTVPYLRITGPSSVVNGVGQTVTYANAPRTSRSGLGDVVVAATHNIYNGGAKGIVVNLTGKVKFGTANSNKGLGTGKNDYALESSIYQAFGDLTAFGTLGYKVYGSPATYQLRNIFFGSFGGSYKYDQATNAGAMLILGQKVTALGSPRTEALLFVNRKLEKNWKMQGYVLKGFTNSVPSWGGGASIDYLF